MLDIEGTTSSISYVYDTMFPYVRDHLVSFLESQWDTPELNKAIGQLADDANEKASDWLDGQEGGEEDGNENGIAQQVAASKIFALMDADSKTTGLKSLQGLIWKSGFESGQLVGHLFDDVAPSIKAWKNVGLKVFIYSSGSIAAQKLYFGNSDAGNLLPLIDGHFDTTIGHKRELPSYQAISQQVEIEANQILFISDVVEELGAAIESKMHTALAIRPGNPATNSTNHKSITSFAEIEVQSSE